MPEQTVTTSPVPARTGTLLYWLCLIYTIVLFAFKFAEFISHGAVVLQGPASVIYFALLAAYAGEKEVRRWTVATPEEEPPGRKGSWFVALWALFALFAIVCVNLVLIMPLNLVYPTELTTITLEVIGIFFGSQASKHLRRSRRARQTRDEDVTSRMLCLIREAGSSSMSVIAEKAGVPRSTANRLVRKLTEEGVLVRVSENPSDPETKYRVA